MARRDIVLTHTGAENKRTVVMSIPNGAHDAAVYVSEIQEAVCKAYEAGLTDQQVLIERSFGECTKKIRSRR